MTPDRTRVDDRQLDEALRTIAAVPAHPDLAARVLRAIHQGAPRSWWLIWRPALVVVVAVAVVALAAIVVWRLAPARPGDIVVTRMDPAPHPTNAPPTSAHSAPPHDRTAAPADAQGPRRLAQGPETSHVRTSAPAHARTVARPEAQGSGRTAQVVAGSGIEEVAPLDLPELLTIARVQTPAFPEVQLQINVLHVRALDIETLDR